MPQTSHVVHSTLSTVVGEQEPLLRKNKVFQGGDTMLFL